MAERNIENYEDSEIGMLDILVTLAESWKLLVFGPLVIGALVGGLSYLWPKTFESEAIVRLTEEEVALLQTATILDPLVKKFGLLANSADIVDDARQELKKRLSYSVDKKNKLVTVIAKGHTPESARELGLTALDLLMLELQPKAMEKELIQQEIAVNNKMISDGNCYQERQVGKQGAVNWQIINLRAHNFELSKRLQAKGKEIYVQEPSLPINKSAPKLRVVILAAISVSIFILLLWVFVSKAWSNALNNPINANKIERIKRALTF